MNRKCDAIQSLFPRYLREELIPDQRRDVEAHTAGCADCRSALEAERLMDARFATPIEAPDSLFVKAQARVIAAAPRPWTERILGRKPMKRLLVSGSALAVLTVIAFGLVPTSAAGAPTARETFRQMKTALTAAKKKMKVLVQVEMTPDNQANVTVTQDGKKVTTPMNVKADVHREGNKVTVFATVSFQESDYSKIAFGKNRNTLVLWPKAQPSYKHEVALDGKSKLPVSWATFAKADKAWRKVGAYRFQYSPRA